VAVMDEEDGVWSRASLQSADQRGGLAIAGTARFRNRS
jgi:hypothetical protein